MGYDIILKSNCYVLKLRKRRITVSAPNSETPSDSVFGHASGQTQFYYKEKKNTVTSIKRNTELEYWKCPPMFAIHLLWVSTLGHLLEALTLAQAPEVTKYTENYFI